MPKSPLIAERREAVRRELEQHGRVNINVSEMARKFGVTEKAVRQDIDKLVEAGFKVDAKELYYNCKLVAEKVRLETAKILDDPKASQPVKVQALRLMIETTARETEWVEKYGLKAKVPDPIEIRGRIGVDPALFAEAFKEYIDDRSRKPAGPGDPAGDKKQ